MSVFKKLVTIFSTAGLLVALASVPTSAATSTIYNNIPTPQPGNLPSQAFEATSTSEFGGQVMFAGTARQNPKVTVLMSSWGCESGHWYSGNCVTTPGSTFSEPITLNIYNVNPDNSPGTLVKSMTSTFSIPYRPSASTTCGDGRWYDGTSCFNGFATPVSFDLTSTTLPDKAIISVAYNTSHYGYAPIGEATSCYVSSAGCGYDSLNVALTSPPTVGSYTNNLKAIGWIFTYCCKVANTISLILKWSWICHRFPAIIFAILFARYTYFYFNRWLVPCPTASI